MAYQHVLFAADFSDEALKVGERAKDIARRYGARLSMIHVVEDVNISLGGGNISLGGGYELLPVLPELPDETLLRESRAALGELASKLELQDAELWVVDAPSTKEGILGAAQDHGVDLIVVGSHGRHGLALLLGSTANAVFRPPTRCCTARRATCWRCEFSGLRLWVYVYRHFERMRATAGHDPRQWRHVAIVSSPSQRDMFFLGHAVVGRIEFRPASAGYVYRQPGVRRIGSDQAGLARRRQGFQIAADVARRQSQISQAGDHQVGEILANAAPLAQDLFERRGDRGEMRIVSEFPINPVNSR